jgi:hypothetical protein
MNNPSVFDLIKRLTDSLPLDPAKVGEALGTRLEPNPAGDTPVLVAYTQAAGVNSSYRDVNLRLPHPLFGTGAGILSVTFKSDGGVNAKAIWDHYGYDFQTDVPSPRYPPETPVYYNYEQPWGTLSLGVTNDAAAKLVSFVMKPKKLG